MNRKLWMSPKTKFESAQLKRDASEFIPMVERLRLKRYVSKEKNHGLKNPRCTGICPLKGTVVSASIRAPRWGVMI